MKKIELLLPAQNLELGRAALSHGADAVYIGAPKFGARQAAGNAIEDIEQLCKEAHFFGSKVYVTLNILLFDEEIEEAVKMAWKLYDVGIDALIIQDMGLLECKMPPIPLHASTQMNNVSVEKVKFLEQCGFRRAILARELSLSEIRAIRKDTEIELEVFVHGSLCVCYSGQCNMSLKLTGRSGNRGECAQVCRSRYDLVDKNGNCLIKNQHLLSLKDMNRASYLQDLVEVGITSFKIEGRLKDITYLKNITAFYRQQLDAVLTLSNNCQKASSGNITYFFESNPSQTFNRNYTSYFMTGERMEMASMSTPKSIGEFVGFLQSDFSGNLNYEGNTELHLGDGLCYWNEGRELEGFFINQIVQNKIKGNRKITLTQKTEVYRNYNHYFEKYLKNQITAVRKIAINLLLKEVSDGFIWTACDEDGICAELFVSYEKQVAHNPVKVLERRYQTFSKLGHTKFTLENYEEQTNFCYFIQDSLLNKVKNELVKILENSRVKYFSPQPHHRLNTYPIYPFKINYLTNIINTKAADFYKKCGCLNTEYGLDLTKDFEHKQLMQCRYCLRFEMKQCPKYYHSVQTAWLQPLFLKDNHHLYRLIFDCEHCQMQLLTLE